MATPGLHCGVQIFSCGMWELVPWSGVKPGPPVLGAQSLSLWTTRGVHLLRSICLHRPEMEGWTEHMIHSTVCPGFLRINSQPQWQNVDNGMRMHFLSFSRPSLEELRLWTQLRLVLWPSVGHHMSVPQFPHLWNGDNTMTFPGVVRGNGNEIVHTQLPELAWHRTRSWGCLPFWVCFFFFLPPLRVLTQMTSGIQSTDHWEKEKSMPNSRDCSRICWWQGLPVAASAPPLL